MNEPLSGRTRLWATLVVTGGTCAGGMLLLAFVYDLNLFTYPSTWWRDHPFDFENILFTGKSMSMGARLWAYDPMHLLGWTPNVFYNPLATLAAGLFVWPLGSGEDAYRIWLLLVLLLSGLVFLSFLPRRTSLAGWILGGLTAAGLSLLVYPMDVGILDANPVQVLYTGQWAQRLGVVIGLLGIQRLFSALQALESNWRQAARRTLTAAMCLGASLFSHYMSGYATGFVMGLLTLHHFLAGRLTGRGWRFGGFAVLALALGACLLLYADFFWMFLSVNHSHHHLPLLEWKVPLGAMATIKEVVIPALPLASIPLVLLGGEEEFNRKGLARAAFPLVVVLLSVAATPGNLAAMFALVFAASLVVCKLDGKLQPRHWLPVGSFGLWLLACGPDSLRLSGLDLSKLLPFGESLGWAKLAAFSRWMFLAWFGVLVAEGLGALSVKRRTIRWSLVMGLTVAGLVLPLALSSGSEERTGAQVFFQRMNETDVHGTHKLLSRMRGVGARTPVGGYLLVEDTLHHEEDSLLTGSGIPNGHLPYMIGPANGRPVLGGAVTTRLITHPMAQTARGQVLCVDQQAPPARLAEVFDRLRNLGVSDILAHSTGLIAALGNYPPALRVDRQAGMVHFALEQYRPILTDEEGLDLPGARLEWRPDGVQVTLPAGTSAFRLRQVYYPFLGCEGSGPDGPRQCRLSSWSEGVRRFTDCLVDDPRPIDVEIPWILAEIEPGPGPVTVTISSHPPLTPFVLMVAAWLAALFFWIKWRGGKRDSLQGDSSTGGAGDGRT